MCLFPNLLSGLWAFVYGRPRSPCTWFYLPEHYNEQAGNRNCVIVYMVVMNSPKEDVLGNV